MVQITMPNGNVYSISQAQLTAGIAIVATVGVLLVGAQSLAVSATAQLAIVAVVVAVAIKYFNRIAAWFEPQFPTIDWDRFVDWESREITFANQRPRLPPPEESTEVVTFNDTISVNKARLVAASDYFRTVLKRGWPVARIEEEPIERFQLLIEFIETGSTQIDEESVLALYVLARAYGVSALQKQCTETVAKLLADADIASFQTVWGFAHEKEALDLKEVCLHSALSSQDKLKIILTSHGITDESQIERIWSNIKFLKLCTEKSPPLRLEPNKQTIEGYIYLSVDEAYELLTALQVSRVSIGFMLKREEELVALVTKMRELPSLQMLRIEHGCFDNSLIAAIEALEQKHPHLQLHLNVALVTLEIFDTMSRLILTKKITALDLTIGMCSESVDFLERLKDVEMRCLKIHCIGVMEEEQDEFMLAALAVRNLLENKFLKRLKVTYDLHEQSAQWPDRSEIEAYAQEIGKQLAANRTLKRLELLFGGPVHPIRDRIVELLETHPSLDEFVFSPQTLEKGSIEIYRREGVEK